MKAKILLALMCMTPTVSLAAWEGDAIQSGTAQVDRFIDGTSGEVSVCRMVLGSRGQSQKPVVAVFGYTHNTQQFHLQGTVNNVDSNYFTVSIDGRQPYTFGRQNVDSVTIGTAGMSFMDDLASAKKSIAVMVEPIGRNMKPTEYVYKFKNGHNIAADVKEFSDCMGI